MSVLEVASRLVESVTESRVWLLGLSEDQVRDKPTPDRWAIAEVIGHMIDSTCNNHQRLIRAQEQPSFEFPGYDQNSWAAKNGYHQSDWRELVELWYLYNRHLAHVIRQIPSDQLQTPCTITPYDTCTLEFLVTDYLDHLNHHLSKIRERVA